MSSDHLRQRLPNRRFRRLFPAAVAAVTIAASAPFAAHAEGVRQHRPNAAHAEAPGKIPTLLRASTTRGDDAESSSAA